MSFGSFEVEQTVLHNEQGIVKLTEFHMSNWMYCVLCMCVYVLQQINVFIFESKKTEFKLKNPIMKKRANSLL